MLTIIIPLMTTPTLKLPSPAPASRPRIDVQQLMQGRQELEIAHRGEVYRLRLTKSGKLILTK